MKLQPPGQSEHFKKGCVQMPLTMTRTMTRIMENPSNYKENLITVKKINNPHDKLFKETFSDLAVTRDFIKHYLPEEILGIINIDTIEPLKDSFIEEELKDAYADLLFKAKLDDDACYFYFLFEHKSSKKTSIAFDLFDYMRKIWKNEREKKKAKEVSFIIPIVFYHGENEWTDVKTIGDWTQGFHRLPKGIQRLSPSFDFFTIDMSPESDTEIAGSPKLQAYLELVKHIYVREREKFYHAVRVIEQLLIDYDVRYLETLFIYMLSAREDVGAEEVKKHLSSKGEIRMVTAADRLRAEGRAEEKINSARKTAKKLFRMGMMSEAQIKEVTELPYEEVAKIKEEVDKEAQG